MPEVPAGLLAPDEVAEGLTHNAVNGAAGGIWRVRGRSRSRVVKVHRFRGTPGPRPDWDTADDPAHWNYWKREWLAYRSGLVATAYAGAGIIGPRLLAALERPDGAVVLSLEDVAGPPAADWSVAGWTDFATRLGAAQAEWVGRPLPYPWMSRGWLRQYAARRPNPVVDWDTPAVAAVWPDELRRGLERLVGLRAALLDVADRAPRTLAHLDVWPANLIGTATGPVLLDWAFTGDGAVGEDVGNLLFDTFADGLVDVARLPEIETALVDGYVAGLGGAVPADEAIRGIHATAAAKYATFAPEIVRRVAAGDRVGSQFYDADRSAADRLVFDRLTRWRPLLERLVDWGRSSL